MQFPPPFKLFACDTDIHVDRLGAAPQPFEMAIEKGEAPMVKEGTDWYDVKCLDAGSCTSAPERRFDTRATGSASINRSPAARCWANTARSRSVSSPSSGIATVLT